ncbi:Rha family transcriptional regulator [Rubrivivax gelatinosus]|uniref:Rha family phage regulatory protein n=1 Tax=Rubrivivax gelatinosus TaxID=28068 RepID=A0A4R2MEF9_RUBGE|nr:Rha family transcriptional regulator [Rubrivivax gelatinosus]TCP03077.1 Rha family phage regulatory protein [Rubrivivax gelatinosus]
MPEGQRGKFLERAKADLARRFGVNYVESIPATRFAGALEAAEQIVDAAIAELRVPAAPHRRPHRQLPLVDTTVPVPAAARAKNVANDALPGAGKLALSSGAGVPLTMSSREIAQLTGKRHDNVMADIRKMLVELHGEGGLLSFQDTHANEQNGQNYPIFRLPKRETLILIAGYSIPLRARIIDRWQELEEQAAGVRQVAALPDFSNPAAAARAWAEQFASFSASSRSQPTERSRRC